MLRNNRLNQNSPASTTRLVAVIGASGYIGRYVYGYLKTQSDVNAIGTYFHDRAFPELIHLDIMDADAVDGFIKSYRPSGLVFLSGTKDIGDCEKHPSHAFSLNAKPVKQCISSIRRYGLDTKIVFFSSNYVFRGDNGPYREQDTRKPSTVYGRTKLRAENYLKRSGLPYAIIRTSTVIGPNCQFLEWIKKTVSKGSQVEAFDDIEVTPTPISMIPKAVGKILDSSAGRQIVHVCGNLHVSRYDLAVLFSQKCSQKADIVPVHCQSPVTPHKCTLQQSDNYIEWTKEETLKYIYNDFPENTAII